MKVTYTVIFILASLLSALAFPSPASNNKKDIEDDVEIVPLGRRGSFDPTIVDTGSVGFGGGFGDFDGIFTRMRQQLDQLLRAFGGGSASSFPNVPAAFPNIPNIDLGKGNTTSVTKIIDGHKVVINETEYNKQGDFGGAFFKVRIIDVKPDSSEATTEANSENNTENTDREIAENSFENEITKSEALDTNNIETFSNIETFDEVEFQPEKLQYKVENAEWESLDEIDGNSINSNHDLRNDIYVNQLLADQAMPPVNPDAEVFYVPPKSSASRQRNKYIVKKHIDPR